MSTARGRGGWAGRMAALLIGLIVFTSGVGVGVLAAPPSGDGIWSGDWIREAYAYISSGLQLAYTTPGRLLIAGPGGNVTTDSGFQVNTATNTLTIQNTTFTGYLTASQDVNILGNLNVTGTSYLGATWLGGALDANGQDITDVDDLNATDAYVSNLYANLTMVWNGTAYENVTETLIYAESEADYLIWVEGATYYAKNGRTGTVTSGSIAATVINAAIAACPNYGYVFLKGGTYDILDTIHLKDHVSLIGSYGSKSTILQGDIANKTYNILEFEVTANGQGFITVENLAIRFGLNGIYMWSSSANSIYEIFLKNIDCFEAGNCGFKLGRSLATADALLYSYIEHCTSDHSGVNGFEIYATETWVNDCFSIQTIENGLYITGDKNQVNNYRSEYDHRSGIVVGGAFIVVNNPFVWNWNFDNSWAYAGIVVSNSQVQVLGGQLYYQAVTAGGKIGVMMDGNFNGNIVSHLQITGNAAQPIAIAIKGDSLADNNIISENILTDASGITDFPATTTIRDNKGFVTESSGTATILNTTTSIAFAHGLSATPTAAWFSIIFTENPTNARGDWWLTCNATHGVLNIENDPGASGQDFSWNARKP